METKVVFDLVGPLHQKRLLDVGTGDGTYAIEARLRGARVTGVDRDPKMLEAARVRASSRGADLILRQGDVLALPFDDASFDVVVAVTVLCFVPDAALALREMTRVLVRGGRLVVADLGRFSLWAAERRIRGWFGSRVWQHARFWSPRDLVQLAQGQGLHVVDIRGCVFFPPSAIAARIGAPIEPVLTRVRAPGAAFLVLAANRRFQGDRSPNRS